MIITDIKEQVKDNKRLSIYIDNKFAFGITKVDALFYKLKIGDEISLEKYNKIIDESIFTKARDKALKLLGLRARSRQEIYNKLKDDYSDEIIDRVLNLLEKYGYIDDEKFAIAYAKDKLKQKGWSKKRIAYELSNKGVDRQIIYNTLENMDFDHSSVIDKLLEKRLNGKDINDYKERQKQFNYLASKGYEFEDIKEAIERYSKR